MSTVHYVSAVGSPASFECLLPSGADKFTLQKGFSLPLKAVWKCVTFRKTLHKNAIELTWCVLKHGHPYDSTHAPILLQQRRSQQTISIGYLRINSTNPREVQRSRMDSPRSCDKLVAALRAAIIFIKILVCVCLRIMHFYLRALLLSSHTF